MVLTPESMQLPRQPRASTQAGIEPDRPIRDALPVHSLALKWAANPMVHIEIVDAIQHLPDILSYQQCKQWDLVATLTQLYLEFMVEDRC